MFLRSLLQRKNKKDIEEVCSLNKGGKNACKTSNGREAVTKAKDRSLSLKDDTNDASGEKHLQDDQSPNSGPEQKFQYDENLRGTFKPIRGVVDPPIPTWPQLEEEAIQCLSETASWSREQTASPDEIPVPAFVGQQGDGTLEEKLSADTKGNARSAIDQSTTEDDDEDEISASESQIEELIREVLNTVSRELATEQMNDLAMTGQNRHTKNSTIAWEGSNRRHIRSVEAQFEQGCDISKKTNETTQVYSKISSSGTDRQVVCCAKFNETSEANNLPAVLDVETSNHGGGLENHHNIERRDDGSRNGVPNADSVTLEARSVIDVVQPITSKCSGNQVNAAGSLENEQSSRNKVIAEEFLQMIMSDICADIPKNSVRSNTDTVRRVVAIEGANDEGIHKEVKDQKEEDQSIYYTLDNLEDSLNASRDHPGSFGPPYGPSNKDNHDGTGKHRFNNVLACKFDAQNDGAVQTIHEIPVKDEETEQCHDVLPIPFDNSTPVKRTCYIDNGHISQTYSEEYFSPKSSFMSFGEIADPDWCSMRENEEFESYRKGEKDCVVFNRTHPHKLDDFVITPCEDSDTDDGEDVSVEEITTDTKTVQVCNDDTDASVRDDTDPPEKQLVGSSPNVVAQTKEEKKAELKNWEEFRRTNMLTAINLLHEKLSEKQERTFGKLKARIEDFTKKTSILTESGQSTDFTEWKATTEDEGELCVLDRRLQSIMDQQASLALSLKTTEERTRLMETQLEQWEVGEKDRQQQIISLREEVEGATARQRSLAMMFNDERRLKEALQLRLAMMTQQKQQLLFNNVMLWEQTSHLELKQEHFQAVSEKERNELEEQMKALESELMALRSLKTGEPVKKVSSESACTVSSDNTVTGVRTPKQADDVCDDDNNVVEPRKDSGSTRGAVSYDRHSRPRELPEGGFYEPDQYPHYRGSHRPNHNNSGFPFPPPRFPPPFAHGSRPRRRGGNHPRVHFDDLPEVNQLPWYPNDSDDFQSDGGRGQRTYRGRGFRGRGRGRGRGYGRGRRSNSRREGQS